MVFLCLKQIGKRMSLAADYTQIGQTGNGFLIFYGNFSDDLLFFRQIVCLLEEEETQNTPQAV
ncbi:hypothetical protein BG910_10270 [Neisseria chenwenguii]|uniref:Uncharacterized protein n=1 Tax=Neisseria chenwenguii TaxID=1853278 RepID=A0A220S3I3_9NEIS|nr:hypothetical protein BG910_10270 [Neisseria chenwenguii]ROV57211.1 hypothetical protein EGS38_00530 [Neisseria chenwenguii]